MCDFRPNCTPLSSVTIINGPISCCHCCLYMLTSKLTVNFKKNMYLCPLCISFVSTLQLFSMQNAGRQSFLLKAMLNIWLKIIGITSPKLKPNLFFLAMQYQKNVYSHVWGTLYFQEAHTSDSFDFLSCLPLYMYTSLGPAFIDKVATSLPIYLVILYIVLTICHLIGYEPTVNFGNQRNLQISYLTVSRLVTNL